MSKHCQHCSLCCKKMITTPIVDNKDNNLIRGCLPERINRKRKCISKRLGVSYNKKVIAKHFKLNQFEVRYSNYNVTSQRKREKIFQARRQWNPAIKKHMPLNNRFFSVKSSIHKSNTFREILENNQHLVNQMKSVIHGRAIRKPYKTFV